MHRRERFADVEQGSVADDDDRRSLNVRTPHSADQASARPISRENIVMIYLGFLHREEVLIRSVFRVTLVETEGLTASLISNRDFPPLIDER